MSGCEGSATFKEVTITAPDGRKKTIRLNQGGEKGAGAQSLGKVGPDTKCGQCRRVMDEGEPALHTAPTWPPSGGFTGYQCMRCLFPPAPEPEEAKPATLDSQRLALLEARVAALEARLR